MALMMMKAEDARLRRIAKRHGFTVSKSRDRIEHTNNRGGYQLRVGNHVVDGVTYELTVARATFCIVQLYRSAQ